MAVLIRVLIPLVIIGLLVFTIIDIITMDERRVRYLPKFAWILLAIVIPVLGPLLWLFLGREPLDPTGDAAAYDDRSRGGPPAPRRSGPLAPDDDPQFLARLEHDRAQEERIRKLEERLAELDDDKPE